jgi:transposase
VDRKKKAISCTVYLGGIFMGKTKKTYSVEFKLAAVKMYFNEDMGYKSVAAELGIHFTMVKRWVKHYEKEGLKGLEEKRGRSGGNGRRRKNLSLNEELVRLKAENEYLKKLLALRRG